MTPNLEKFFIHWTANDFQLSVLNALNGYALVSWAHPGRVFGRGFSNYEPFSLIMTFFVLN